VGSLSLGISSLASWVSYALAIVDVCPSRPDVMRSLEPRRRPPAGVPLFHSADAERRLRALHAELRSTTRSCYVMANELELAGDSLKVGRFAAAGAALERVLDECFADLERTA